MVPHEKILLSGTPKLLIGTPRTWLFFILFYSYFTSICNPLGYDRLKYSICTLKIQPGCCPLLFHFCLVSPLNFAAFGFYPPESCLPPWLQSVSNSSPSLSFLCSHSSSLCAAPSLLPISVFLKNFNSASMACSLANKLATHFLSGLACQSIFRFFSSCKSGSTSN